MVRIFLVFANTLTVSDRLSLDVPDAEQRLEMPAGFARPGMYGPQVDALVDFQPLPQLALARAIEVALEPVGDLGGAPVIAQYTIWFPPVEHGQPTFARRHRRALSCVL